MSELHKRKSLAGTIAIIFTCQNTHQSVHGSLVGMGSPVAYVTPSISHSVTVNKENAWMRLTLSEMSHTVADIQIVPKFGLVVGNSVIATHLGRGRSTKLKT